MGGVDNETNGSITRMSQSKTTDRQRRRAAKLLRDAGWTVLPPVVMPRDNRDQCEFPDLRGEPGDCCTNLTSRNRKTDFGTMWLCCEHFHSPLSQLFDLRLENQHE